MDTLDIRGVPEKYIPWLKQIVKELKSQEKFNDKKNEKIVFATHKSHLVGGYSRTAAYKK